MTKNIENIFDNNNNNIQSSIKNANKNEETISYENVKFDESQQQQQLQQQQNSITNTNNTNNNNNNNNNQELRHSTSLPIFLTQLALIILIIITAILIFHLNNKRQIKTDLFIETQNFNRNCAKTCRIELVESIPQNLTFEIKQTTKSTFDVWNWLIKDAKHSLSIAAYKSSLRGKHVFGLNFQQKYSLEGEQIYEELLNAGLKNGVNIRMVENGPSKDRGDNEDGTSLQKRGAIKHRQLNLRRIFNTGIMHSKFIVADGKDFYLGSANLDWRSLNQDCSCLAQDLNSIFEVYWRLANAKTRTAIDEILRNLPAIKFNADKPLRLADPYATSIYLAASPQPMNSPGRSWDLDSIINAINNAKKFAYIHVMDYFPMFMYTNNNRYWPKIDNALRSAIMRGVHVKIIAAALHNPTMGLNFLKSLECMHGFSGGSISIKIFKVPSSNAMQSVIRRDRRTHKKFLITDDTVIIGTSNWSGDYFEARGTGVAIVIKQENNNYSVGNGILQQIKKIFEREFTSKYTHSLDKYMKNCLFNSNNINNNYILNDMCELEKDVSLLHNNNNNSCINL